MVQRILYLIALICLTRQQNDQRINISIYSESLCPGCIQFYKGSFKEAVNTPEIQKIANIRVLSYGNAQQSNKTGVWQFTCQHGQHECEGNIVETCARNYFNETQFQQWKICLDEKIDLQKVTDFEALGKDCANQLNINYEPLFWCQHSTLGCDFEHQVGVETENLNPPHKWVPWITVDQQFDQQQNDDVLNNMLKFICMNYKGEVKISACQDSRKLNQSFEKVEVCQIKYFYEDFLQLD